jgi:hypothetical protein
VLIALGAILYWAVSVDAQGFDINMTGLILMIVGVVGLILTLVLTAGEQEAVASRSDRDVTIVERRP